MPLHSCSRSSAKNVRDIKLSSSAIALRQTGAVYFMIHKDILVRQPDMMEVDGCKEGNVFKVAKRDFKDCLPIYISQYDKVQMLVR